MAVEKQGAKGTTFKGTKQAMTYWWMWQALSATSQGVQSAAARRMDDESLHHDAARAAGGRREVGRRSADLRAAFPEMKGFSSSNLKYMRFFAKKYPAGLIGQHSADQLPWFHLVTLSRPIGVAEYQLVRALPEPLDTNLPSIEEIEAEFSRAENER